MSKYYSYIFYADRNVRPCTILGYTLTTFPKSRKTLMHNQSNRDLWHHCKRNNNKNKLHLNASRRRTLHHLLGLFGQFSTIFAGGSPFPLILAVTSSFTVAGDCSCASDPSACFSISSSICHVAPLASSFSICSLTTLLSSTVCLQLSAIFILKQIMTFHQMHYLFTVLLYIL